MIFYKHQKVLNPFISHIFSNSFDRDAKNKIINEFILPSGHCLMAFQCIGKYKIVSDNKETTPPKAYITGQQIKSFNFVSSDPVIEVIIVVFKPTALYHLFGLDTTKLINNVISVEEAFKSRLRVFNKHFENAKSYETKMGYVEELLLKRLEQVAPKLNVIDISIDLIHKNKGRTSIKKLVTQLKISERYFQKKFKKIVGITPFAYTKITRFSYLFAEMSKIPDQNYKDLSDNFDYYDIAHFSKDFKKYCGDAPTKFNIDKYKFIKKIMVDDPLILKIK